MTSIFHLSIYNLYSFFHKDIYELNNFFLSSPTSYNYIRSGHNFFLIKLSIFFIQRITLIFLRLNNIKYISKAIIAIKKMVLGFYFYYTTNKIFLYLSIQEIISLPVLFPESISRIKFF